MEPWEMDWSGAAAQEPWQMDWSNPKPQTMTAREALAKAASASNFSPQANERLTSLGKGLIRGVTSDLPGLPMDTLVNLKDLASAGHGAIMGARGASAAQLPDLTDRSRMPLTSDWFARLTGQDAALGNDPVSNMFYQGGRFASGSLLGPPGMMPRAATAGGAAGAAAQGAAEAGLPPSSQILASLMVPYAARWGAGKEAQLNQAAIDQATHDKNIRAGQEANLVFPPMAVNPVEPGTLNRSLTGLAGQQATAQAASVKNYSRVADAARQDLGIRGVVDDTAIKEVIKRAGDEGYAPIRAIPEIPNTRRYIQQAQQLEAQYQELAAANPSLASPATAKAIDGMFKDSFTGNQAVEVIRSLRSDAAANLAAIGDPDKNRIGTYQKRIADITENLVEEHLKATGNEKQYRAFVDARKKIAQAYSYLEAWDKGSGQIAGVNLADQWKEGAPLSGKALKVAQAAAAVPDAFKIVKNPNPGMGFMTGAFGAGGVLSALQNDPKYLAVAALPYARPALRSLMLSNPYQKMFAQPGGKPSSSANLLKSIFPEDMGGLLGGYGMMGP